ncbi:O-antigen polymerase [Carnobacterium sp. FSL W8-0810]|uniref:O-antigen polymerase n=1 Tax=Carnobacterium sp. FSL W8-0810 TaxID=2954705 RepID=UPI0030FBB267
MELLLFLLILLQLMFALIVLKSLIHPIIILKMFCALSAFVLIFYSEIWGLYISLDTVIIFITGLIWVDFGFFIFAMIYNKKGKGVRIKKDLRDNQNQQFSVIGTLVILFFMILTVIIFLNNGKSNIQLGSGIEKFSQSLIMLKVARRDGVVPGLGLLQYAITACTIIGIVYTYVCIEEWLENGFSKRVLIFSLPVIVTFILFFMTGRRSFLLNIILIFLIITYEYILRKYKTIPLKFQFKFLYWIIVLFSGFFLFFVTVGKLFLKAGDEGTNLFDTFAVYLSGGIISFDKVYEYYSLSSTIFGQNILRIFYEILNFIPGVNFPTETINESLYMGNNFVTNVFTVNLPYMADFGYAGVIIGNTFIGIFYSLLYYKSKNEEKIGFWNLLYAFSLTYILSYTGSERFFVPMTLNVQYILIFLILLKTPLLYKKKKKELI